jgi:hypothetical protein
VRCIFIFVDFGEGGGGDGVREGESLRHKIFAKQLCIEVSIPILAKRTSVLIFEHGARIYGVYNSEKEFGSEREEVTAA